MLAGLEPQAVIDVDDQGGDLGQRKLASHLHGRFQHDLRVDRPAAVDGQRHGGVVGDLDVDDDRLVGLEGQLGRHQPHAYGQGGLLGETIHDGRDGRDQPLHPGRHGAGADALTEHLGQDVRCPHRHEGPGPARIHPVQTACRLLQLAGLAPDEGQPQPGR